MNISFQPGNAQRAIQKAANEAEAEMHRLESRTAEMGAEFEQPELYETAEGVRCAADMQRALNDLEEEVVIAIEHWTNAAEALDTPR